MAEWWEGNFEQRMARRRIRRRQQGLVITSEQSLETWKRHGEKVVLPRKRKARKPFNYEQWLHQKAGEQMTEDRIAGSRLKEIWNAIVINQMNKEWRRSAPIQKVLKAAPRIRGCGAAAKRAGF